LVLSYSHARRTPTRYDADSDTSNERVVMPVRSTRVMLHNRTPFTLSLTGSSLDHGDWTPPSWNPPGSIPPGATLGWQSESDGVATGTEGTATYAIGNTGQTLSIHWDNPYVGLNSYHQSVGPGFGVSFSGGKGNNAEADYTLQPDAPVVVPDFLPSLNGFPFENSWPGQADTYIELPPFTWWGNGIKIGDASNGMCGGMSYAVRDYYVARLWPAQTKPFGVGDPLYDYIVRRLFDSFNSPLFGSCDPGVCGGWNILADVADFQTQMDPVYPDSDNYITDGAVGDGRAWIMAHEAWPQIQADIDSGVPCPLGLVLIKSLLPTDLGKNHQVLIYGYQLSQQHLTLFVYDPNSPGKDNVRISLDISDTGEPIAVTHNVGVSRPIYSFFALRYDTHAPAGGFSESVIDTQRRLGQGGLGAIARTPAHLDVFWTSPDGAILSTWYDAATGMGWGDHQPFAITPPGFALPGTPVTAVARTKGHQDVFWVNVDGSVWSMWWDEAPGMSWGDHAPFAIAPPGAAKPRSAIAAVARTPDHLDVFWIGPDGGIGSTWYDSAPGQSWGDHAPFGIAPPGAAQDGSGLTAVARNPNHLDVFWVGRDGAIGSTWYDSAPGSGWGDHAPFAITPSNAARAGSAVAAVARTPDHLDVFWIGPDSAIGSTWFDMAPGMSWGDHKPFAISPPGYAGGASNLCAVSRFSNHTDVFWIGPDGAVVSTWYDSAQGMNWGDHAPFAISPPNGAQAGSTIAAVGRTPNHLDVFWIGPDGAVGSTWFDLVPGSGWGDHAPFAISSPEVAQRPSAQAPSSASFAAARTCEHLDVFWSTPNGAIGSMWWDEAPKSGWGDHAPFFAAQPGSAPAGALVTSVSRKPNQLDVFWINADGSVWSTWWNGSPGSSWGDHTPFPIAPPKSAQPGTRVAAIGRTPDHLDVFWIGQDGAVGSTWWDAAPGQNWGDHKPFAIAPPGAAQAGSGLAAVARSPMHMDIFWIGPDGAVGSTWWDAAPKSSWGDHSPFPITKPGAARAQSPITALGRTPSHLDVFWIGPDGSIGSTWWAAAPKASWTDHGAFVVTPPNAAVAGSDLTAVARSDHHMDVFWIGPDGAIGSTWYDSAPGLSWGDHSPFPVTPPNAAHARSPIAAVGRITGHLDVFWIGPDSAVASTWFDETPKMSWGDHAPFAITPQGAAKVD